jgi:hypothetical protein
MFRLIAGELGEGSKEKEKLAHANQTTVDAKLS